VDFTTDKKNRGGFPPLFMLDVSTDDYDNAKAAIETDSAVNQANTALNCASEWSVLFSEP
jgi:hypothetical protein